MRKFLGLAGSMLILGLASQAQAAITLSATPGSNPYSGPSPTYTFSGSTPVTGGDIVSGTNSSHAQPWGGTGNYFAVGPSDGSPGFLNLSSYAAISAISFIWGSVDSYNTLEVISRTNTILASFTGSNAAVNPNGNQSNPATNPLALITISGTDMTNIGGLRLRSSQNAFEIDNVTITRGTAVPEPATWLSMIVGFAAMGMGLRRKQHSVARVRYS